VALVRSDVSDELSASFIRVTRIGELGTDACCEEIKEPHGVTSQQTPFFIVTAVNTSNLKIVVDSHHSLINLFLQYGS
jgi:hypothetical protein